MNYILNGYLIAMLFTGIKFAYLNYKYLQYCEKYYSQKTSLSTTTVIRDLLKEYPIDDVEFISLENKVKKAQRVVVTVFFGGILVIIICQVLFYLLEVK